MCKYVMHLSVIDYIAISCCMDRSVLEFVDHLHEHFVCLVSINARRTCNVPGDPSDGYSIEMHKASS